MSIACLPSGVREIGRRARDLMRSCTMRCAIAGSIRRGVPVPGDVDLLAIPWFWPTSREAGAALITSALAEVGVLAETRFPSLRFTIDDVRCDLLLTTPARWGCDLLTLTGSREFNDRWRDAAMRAGMRVEYFGSFSKVDAAFVYLPETVGMSEGKILRLLGLEEYRDPVSRGGWHLDAMESM